MCFLQGHTHSGKLEQVGRRQRVNFRASVYHLLLSDETLMIRTKDYTACSWSSALRHVTSTASSFINVWVHASGVFFCVFASETPESTSVRVLVTFRQLFVWYSLSRHGSQTVCWAPQGWTTPSPGWHCLQHSPLCVYWFDGHAPLLARVPTCRMTATPLTAANWRLSVKHTQK